MATYRKAPTRKDVAQLAGVSETIVSYVLNNNRYVAKDKRERVLEAVRQLQYRPNNIARALKGKRTNHILFICDNISNEYFGRLVEEMDRISYEKGFLISLLRGRNDDQFVSQVISRVFDGIVISSTSFEERHVVEIINSGVPVVLLMNREYDSVGDRASKIYTGLQNGVRDCVTLLAGQGRKHIVYIDRVSQNHRNRTLDDRRNKGFNTKIQECGFKVTKDNVVVGYESEEQLYEGFRLRLQNGLKVDGIVGRNDSLACTAMTAAMSVGLRVPEDVAVIGFDNSRLCSYISPRLSSVELNKPAIAAEILNAFEHMLAGQGPVEKRLQAQLIEREST